MCVSHFTDCIGVWQEARIDQINCSATFEKVKHQEIHFKLCSVGTGWFVLSVLSIFETVFSDQSQYVVVDGCWSNLINVVSGVPQGSIIGPLLFLLFTSELFHILENKLYAYADDSTVVPVV